MLAPSEPGMVVIKAPSLNFPAQYPVVIPMVRVRPVYPYIFCSELSVIRRIVLEDVSLEHDKQANQSLFSTIAQTVQILIAIPGFYAIGALTTPQGFFLAMATNFTTELIGCELYLDLGRRRGSHHRDRELYRRRNHRRKRDFRRDQRQRPFQAHNQDGTANCGEPMDFR